MKNHENENEKGNCEGDEAMKERHKREISKCEKFLFHGLFMRHEKSEKAQNKYSFYRKQRVLVINHNYFTVSDRIFE